MSEGKITKKEADHYHDQVMSSLVKEGKWDADQHEPDGNFKKRYENIGIDSQSGKPKIIDGVHGNTPNTPEYEKEVARLKNVNTEIHYNHGNAPDAPEHAKTINGDVDGNHAVDTKGKAGAALSALGVSAAVQNIERAFKTGKQEDILSAVVATATAATDIVADVGKIPKIGNTFGAVGNLLTGGYTIYSASKSDNNSELGAAIGGTLLGTVAGVAMAATATAAAAVTAPAIAIGVGVVTVATVVGEKIGGPVAEMVSGEISASDGFRKLGTNLVRLNGDVIDAVGKVATGLGDTVQWAGKKVEQAGAFVADAVNDKALDTANDINDYAKTAGVMKKPLQAAAAVVAVTGQVASEVIKAHAGVVTLAGKLVSGVGNTVSTVGNGIADISESVVGTALSALGYDSEKTIAKKIAPQAAVEKPTQNKPVELTEKQIDKQLANHLHILEEKGWGGKIGNGDKDITLEEIKKSLADKGVKLKDLDKNHDGNITGREITDALSKLPNNAQAQNKSNSR